jgi:hypothetical protein
MFNLILKGEKTLENSIKELSEVCNKFKNRSIDTTIFYNSVKVLRDKIFELTMVKKRLRSQSAYNFFNLCDELLDAFSFDNKDLSIINDSLIALNNKLEDLYLSESWRHIRKLSGPIEIVEQYECQNCKLNFPVIGFSGFVDLINAYCENCGSILFIDQYNQILNELFEKGKENLSIDPYKEFEKKLPVCICKGIFRFSFGYKIPFDLSHGECPQCYSKQFSKYKISKYEYFQKHEYFYLNIEEMKIVH